MSRIVEASLVDEWAKKIESMDDEVEAIMKEEKEEKQLGQAEMQVKKGENIMEFQGEIMARPKRTWFESEKEKKNAKSAGRVELNGMEQGKAKKKGNLSGKDKKKLDDTRERVEGKMWKKGKADRDGKGGKGGVVKGGKPKRAMASGGRTSAKHKKGNRGRR